MSEEDYIDQIRSIFPDEGDVPYEVIELIEEGIVENPSSERLWVLRGHLIVLCTKDSNDITDALLSYKRALKINPLNVQTYEDIGYYYEELLGDEVEAGMWFAKADQLKYSYRN
ncbi:MAG: hypothetical protein ABUK01_01930 [Leptospirales bacterium]